MAGRAKRPAPRSVGRCRRGSQQGRCGADGEVRGGAGTASESLALAGAFTASWGTDRGAPLQPENTAVIAVMIANLRNIASLRIPSACAADLGSFPYNGPGRSESGEPSRQRGATAQPESSRRARRAGRVRRGRRDRRPVGIVAVRSPHDAPFALRSHGAKVTFVVTLSPEPVPTGPGPFEAPHQLFVALTLNVLRLSTPNAVLPVRRFRFATTAPAAATPAVPTSRRRRCCADCSQ